MKKLIELFNKKYGHIYGVIDDSIDNEDVFKAYKIIKTLCADDTEMMELLDKVKLPEPKTAKESIEKININVNGGSQSDLVVQNSITVGTRNKDSNIGEFSCAIGDDVTASGYCSHAEGNFTIANGEYSHAEGSNTTANGYASHAEGNGTYATALNSHAEGNGTTASGEASHTEGRYCQSTALTAHAEGDYCNATGIASHAEGGGTHATGNYSHSEGYSAEASGENSHAEGCNIIASGTNSHAEGSFTTASAEDSHAEGISTTALGNYSHAEGYSSNKATDTISNLSSNTSNDDIITAWNTTKFSLAKSEASHVEGKNSLALGKYSHAENSQTVASGQSSHAEGVGSTASGLGSHAEGHQTVASGQNAHSEGFRTTASGKYSHAQGYGTIASSLNQHVDGKYNIEDTESKYVHITGNGTSETTRRNAYTLDWSGNGWYSGKLSQEGTPTEDKDVVTKKYMEDTIALMTGNAVNNNLPSNGSLTLTTNKFQTTTLATDTEVILPTVEGYTEIHLFFLGISGTNILDTNVAWNNKPTIEDNKKYEFIYTYVNSEIGWLGKAVVYTV